VRISVFAAVMLIPAAAFAAAQNAPEWAFPNEDVGPKPPAEAAAAAGAAGERQAPDPASPMIVLQGKEGGVRACNGCHFVNGMGEPQTSPLAGLPSAYFVKTMADFRSGVRKGPRAGNMITMAKLLTDDENKVIADYYAGLKPKPFVKVIEMATAPKTYVGNNNQRRAWPAGGDEPIGERVVEFAVDSANLRSATSQGHVAYAPPGSIAEGQRLVTTGGGKTIACTNCHGADLNGTAEAPALAGRSPVYEARQLYQYKNGDRAGPNAEVMKAVVESLSDHDIVAIAAYLASRPPL
jgi:cytochrome c553